MSRVDYMSSSNTFQAVYDVLVLILVYIVSSLTDSKYYIQIDLLQYSWLVFASLPVWLFFMNAMRVYDKIMYFSYAKIIKVVFAASVLIVFTNSIMSHFIKEETINPSLFIIYSCLTLLVMTAYKLLFKFFATKQNSLVKREARIVIVGAPDTAQKFVSYINENDLNFNIIGYVQITGLLQHEGLVKLGSIEDIATIVKDNSIDEVIFALPKFYFAEIEKYIMECEEMGITVRMILDIYNLKIAKTYLTNMGSLPMLTFDTVQFSRFQLFVKRLIDIVGALIGIFITGMLSIFLVAAIKMESTGPVLFTQNRVGLNGRTFKLYKFRSMCLDAEDLREKLESQNEVKGGFMFKIKHDPRITRVGNFIRKTSIDELPQFVNVLKGEMSLVGTRPPTIDEVSRYKNYQRRRISIKPGLTGMWQVSGRSGIKNFDEVVRLDTKYIDEWSLWLDIKIILKTVLVVFSKKSGAC